jgi:transposase
MFEVALKVPVVIHDVSHCKGVTHGSYSWQVMGSYSWQRSQMYASDFKWVTSVKPSPGQNYSAKQAAELVGISYITLRRWLARGDFPTSIAVPVGGGKTIRRFTREDIGKLRKFKEEYYCAGRGRTPSLRQDAARQRNAWKASKRWSRSYGLSVERAKAERKAARKAIRQYETAVRALRKVGITVMCPKCEVAMQRL